MQDPFFSNFNYNFPPSTPSFYYSNHPSPSYPSSPYPSSSSSSKPRKVRSVPIQYVSSNSSELTESDSALIIQKTFRGFQVRRNVNKIKLIKKDVEEVEKKLEEREFEEVVKRDDKERLKMNEALMASLLKLDSVRAFDGCVRDLRKKVIKKAIMLQEKIDDLSSGNVVDTEINGTGDNFDAVESDFGNNVVNEGVFRVSVDDDDNVTNFADNEGAVDDDNNNEEIPDMPDDDDDDYMTNFGNSGNEGAVDDDNNNEEIPDMASVDEAVKKIDDVTVFDKFAVHEEKNQKLENNIEEEEAWECVGEETETEPKSEFVEVKEADNGGGEEEEGERRKSSSTKGGSEDWFVVGNKGEERKRGKELMFEKMVKDNEKLMAMVADLCEKNATQTSLICSLSERVEQLEKAMNERAMRKKKKKSNKNGCVNLANAYVYM